jgi:predicted DCC family thiol-disulfide oxidoreductase YuxK
MPSDLPERIVFFDGVCAFCDGTVRWLTDRDSEGRLHFAPLQGETAAIARTGFSDRFPRDVDTIVYLRPGPDGHPDVSKRSTAVLEILRDLGGGWSWLAVLRFLPTPVADGAYRVFARNRYRWFGTLHACDTPTPGERQRLLP